MSAARRVETLGEPAVRGGPVTGPGRVRLDVRDDAAFAAGHAPGSGHLPRREFAARRAELPPRECPVLVLADQPDEAAAAARELEARGFLDVAWLGQPLAEVAEGRSERGPAARLWRPASFLAEVLPGVRAALGPGAHAAADLAAGSGREAVHLALAGFEVEAWDHAPEALGRAAELARRCGVAIHARLADLAAPGGAGSGAAHGADTPLPAGRYALITVFRFLARALFPAIERALAPGGWLVYETYRAGQERFGRPRSARFLLRAGELSSAFPTLSVVRYEEPAPAGGPLTARLLARKPPGDPPRSPASSASSPGS